jgi:hypothetical protein
VTVAGWFGGGLRREAEERFDFIPQAGRLAGFAAHMEGVAGTRTRGTTVATAAAATLTGMT